MGKHFFLSDAHFGARRGVSEGADTDFVTLCSIIESERGELYLVGDLFDFFFDYKSVVPRNHFNILFAIHKLTTKGLNVTYVTGNHDFWLGDFLEKEIGITVVHGRHIASIDGLDVCLQHGDNFFENTTNPSLFGRIVKNRANRVLYRMIHPDLAIPLALKISEFSRKRVEANINREKVIHSYRMRAKTLLAELKCDAVIAGHTHFADSSSFRNGIYINTGNWMTERDYVILEKGKFTHMKFHNPDNTRQ